MLNIIKENNPILRFEIVPAIGFGAHIHEDIELVYTEKGGSIAFCDGREYPLKDHSFFLVCPYQVHRYVDNTEGDYIVVIVNPKNLCRYSQVFANGIPTTPVLQLDEQQNAELVALLKFILNENKVNGYSGIVEGLLAGFFGMLLRYYQLEKQENRSNKATEILQYCLTHYRERITVEDIAHSLNVSRSYVSHTFSTCFSINFCAYINSLRLLDAAELLKSTSLSVTEIALAVGFSNIRSFNRAFAKQYGMTPMMYRKKKRTTNV